MYYNSNFRVVRKSLALGLFSSFFITILGKYSPLPSLPRLLLIFLHCLRKFINLGLLFSYINTNIDSGYIYLHGR